MIYFDFPGTLKGVILHYKNAWLDSNIFCTRLVLDSKHDKSLFQTVMYDLRGRHLEQKLFYCKDL